MGVQLNLNMLDKLTNQKLINNPLKKIHLGCGKKYFKGFINVDMGDSTVADIKADILTLDYGTDYFERIEMYHLIEHINKFDAEDLLKRLFKSLKNEGALVIECPDVVKVSKLVIKHQNNLEELETGAEGFRGFFGEPFPVMHFGDYHKWGYSEDSLSKILISIGFNSIFIEKPQAHGQRLNRDLRIVAQKNNNNPIKIYHYDRFYGLRKKMRLF